MAKIKETASFMKTSKKERPGMHAKAKTSKLKSSKLYKKKYKGQGK